MRQQNEEEEKQQSSTMKIIENNGVAASRHHFIAFIPLISRADIGREKNSTVDRWRKSLTVLLDLTIALITFSHWIAFIVVLSFLFFHSHLFGAVTKIAPTLW